jgi:HAD superfamily hydrolase (TIGR01484 family)
MRFLALCTDYDGTIAHHGRVDEPTIDALTRLRDSGRKVIMVTGREIDDLATVFDRFDLFERIVAENGALIYDPATREERLLGERPPDHFVEELRRRSVERISVGRSIVATWEPHENTVLETIRDLGLELQVIFNKGAVMILPAGVNKATGLKAALDELNLSVHNSVGVGDAENDHAFLRICECSAAVANALPAVKAKADIVLEADHGAGVTQLIEEMLAEDLAMREPALVRHHVELGLDERGEHVRLSPYATNALIVGTSGGGKSTVAVGLVERLRAQGYSFCIIDPEGDYDNVEGVVVLGSPEHAPTVDECLQLLRKPDESAVVNLLGLKLKDRPAFFLSLFAQLRDLRAKTGRPHWTVIDEAHHVLPEHSQPPDLASPERLTGVLMISVSPQLVAQPVLRNIETLIVVGEKPQEMLGEFATANGMSTPRSPAAKLDDGSALVWNKSERGDPRRVHLTPSRTERRRHLRKYAEGALPEDRSFYFRGPQGRLKLRAHNLILFLDLADGVDEETWLHHLRRGEVSEWLRSGIKDEALAGKIAAIERDRSLDADASRRQIRELIEAVYTLPAGSAEAQKAAKR